MKTVNLPPVTPPQMDSSTGIHGQTSGPNGRPIEVPARRAIALPQPEVCHSSRFIHAPREGSLRASGKYVPHPAAGALSPCSVPPAPRQPFKDWSVVAPGRGENTDGTGTTTRRGAGVGGSAEVTSWGTEALSAGSAFACRGAALWPGSWHSLPSTCMVRTL